MCLALRDDHGQLARTATNYDGLVVSALVEAQLPAGPPRRQAGPCPLRGMRGTEVSMGAGARLAGAVSLVLASAKVSDHVVDADGVFGRQPVASVARRVARRWAGQGSRTGADLGFDTAVLLDAVHRQPEVEALASTGSSVLAVTEPTETASAAAFAHTAVLGGRPGNMAPLAEVGRLFGRVVHLLDAVEDLAADRATGAWNPLTATGTSVAEARRLCNDAALGARLALREAEFTDAKLVHVLLAHELDHAIDRTFSQAGYPGQGAHPGPPGAPPTWQPHTPPDWQAPVPPEPPRRRGFFAGCAMATMLFCTCQVCCASEYEGPWSGKKREGCMNSCDCCPDSCCCDGCNCCDGCCCDCSC